MRFIDGWPTELDYSHDDGGWYVTVINRDGSEAYQSDVYPDKRDAINDAGKFTETHTFA